MHDHNCRLYMTVGVYQGRKIVAYVASCRRSGCDYIGTYLNPSARSRGIRKHQLNAK